MSKYKTKKQKIAFAQGLIIAVVLNIGGGLCKIEGWGPYVGIPMILFGFICAYQYTKDDPKNKEDEINEKEMD